MNKLKTLVVGCGNMGVSHARAYHQLSEFEIVGLVSRKPESREKLSKELGGLPTYANFDTALRESKPDVVSINTYPDTHADYVRKSLNAGAHVFVEKPLALTVEEAEELVTLAKEKNRKMVVGYILRVHPSWTKFVEVARTLGKPLVMRMNLNQQSSGDKWYTHKQLMNSMSPIVDCGVHYVDIMCLMTQSIPISVSAIGANLSKDSSHDIEGHTKTGSLQLHYSELTKEGDFVKKDDFIRTEDEPDHDGLCLLEQVYLLNAIKNDEDLSSHLRDAINSLKIVLAADESVRTGQTVIL